MPQLKNPRWEKFCLAFVELGNASKAYRKAGYSHKSCDADAVRLRGYESIQRRISELRAKSLLCHEMNREELERYFASVVNTPVGEVDAHHPLAQSLEISKNGTKIRLPDKNTAAMALARMRGYDVQRVELQASNPLTDYLRSLRSADAKVIEDSGDDRAV